MQVDKNTARLHFSRAAHTYDKWSRPQAVMADKLLETLCGDNSISSILEIGCGTGLLTERLEKAYPAAKIAAIDIALGMVDECRRKWPDSDNISFSVEDAEEFIPGNQFDLIISNSCFQWMSDLGATLSNLARYLTPTGTLAFSAPACGSLHELWASYEAAAPGKNAGHHLPEPEDYVATTIQAGLQILTYREETHLFTYDDPQQAVDSIRGTGATRAIRNAGAGLTRSEIRSALARYAQDFSTAEGSAICTYRVAYIKAGR